MEEAFRTHHKEIKMGRQIEVDTGNIFVVSLLAQVDFTTMRFVA